jgi:formate dehydrogenase alpha subunit
MSKEEGKVVPIVCPICGVGCNTELKLDSDGIPKKVVVKGRNPDLNGKFICIKGLIVADLLNHEDRLRKPLKDINGEFKELSWDQTFQAISKELKEIINKYGNNSIGVLVSGKISNEEAYLAQKFARTIIKTNNVDTCARLCHSPSEVGLRMQFGFGAVSASLEDFSMADVVMLIGANTRFTHPGVWNVLRRREKEKKLIVADIYNAITDPDIKLTPKPETDLIWINGLCKIIVEEKLYDKRFIDNRSIGFRRFVKSLENYNEEYIENKTNISYDKLREVAELITKNNTLFVWGMGLTQHGNGTDAILSIGNLAILTGNIGKEGTGVVPLRGQNNVQGAVDMGSAPFGLTGGYDTNDEGALIHFEGFWDTEISKEPGFSATEMIHNISTGKMKALYVIGENPVLSEPQSAFVRWMLEDLDLLIVQDIFLTETAKLADYVLPAAALGEKDGTFTNAHRRIQYSEKAVEPPGESKPDWEITMELANHMGYNWQYSSTEGIWNEIRELAPIFRGASYSRLKNSYGLFWPVYDEKDKGSRRLYTKRFMFRDGRARFYPVYPPSYIKKTTKDYPIWLITHRLYEQFNTGEMTLRSKITSKNVKDGFVALNSLDAEELGISKDSLIRITSPYGSIKSPVKIIKGMRVPRGHIFAPIHFFKYTNFNELTTTFPLDPRARMPSLKKIPVNIEKV